MNLVQVLGQLEAFDGHLFQVGLERGRRRLQLLLLARRLAETTFQVGQLVVDTDDLRRQLGQLVWRGAGNLEKSRSKLGAAGRANLVKHPELRSLKREVQQSRREFDSRSQHRS